MQTLNNITAATMLAISRHSDAIMKLQEQASTGSRVNRVSDDPVAGNQMLSLTSSSKDITGYIANIDSVMFSLDSSMTSMQRLSDLLNSAQQSLTQVLNGTYSEEARVRTAESINNMLEEAVSAANTKSMNQYLFGGDKTDTAPYEVIKDGDEIISVRYTGSDSSLKVRTSDAIETAVFKSGKEMFGVNSNSEITFKGSTGAEAATGTSNIKGFKWLSVTHDEANGKYVLSINDGADTFEVPDDGTGSSNLAVKDSTTGEVVYVDTAGITSAGSELICAPGRSDIFSTLIMVRDLCRNTQNLSSVQVDEAVNTAVEQLRELSQSVTGNSSAAGLKLNALDKVKQDLEDTMFNTQTRIEKISQADITQVAIELSTQQVLYEMSLSAAGKMLSLSLIDFLQ